MKIQSAMKIKEKNLKMLDNSSDTSEETRLLLMSGLKNKVQNSLSR